MNDILQDLSGALAEIENGIRNTMSDTELYLLLSRAVGEIDRLRRRNIELSWIENPDRSGGQFTEWELNRRGDEFS
jgi:hypothetical protein